MKLAETCSLFMHALNLQLHQVVGTMVISWDLEEVIEIVKKATVYGEDKGSTSQVKKRKQTKTIGQGKDGKGSKGNWTLVVDKKQKPKLF